MFILHTSNQTENLLAHLAQVIKSQPLRSLFAAELFLVQSQGMERWLSQQLALHFEVWAHYRFLFPGKFFSEIAQVFDVSLNDKAFEREQIVWRLEALLRETDSEPLAPLRKFIDGDNQSLKRFQLAQRLAQVFDQYQILRPDMLSDWQRQKTVTQHSSETWQRWLWLRLTDEMGTAHRGELWRQAIAIMDRMQPDEFIDRLPERVSIFGLNTMPPLFIAFLQSLSRHCQVHLYLLNPTQAYWADLDSQRQIARRNYQAGVTTPINPVGHPLLASLGQQGREFQQILLEQANFTLEYQSFEPAVTDTKNNLQCLQNDLLNNDQQPRLLKVDGSISIHACHSQMREVQVIKDQLLAVLENTQTLELRDIVVMAPNIQSYEPFITAVFSDIDHAIADRSLRSSNDVLDTFIQFLRLSQSRFGWLAVLELLEHSTVYPAFGLAEIDLPLIQHWVHATNIRWGRSATHKKALGLPEEPGNTWDHGLERLLMGYMMGMDEDFVDGVLPYAELEGTSAQALGGLYDYLQFLYAAGERMTEPRTLTAWTQIMTEFAQSLFSLNDDSGMVDELNEILGQLASGPGEIHKLPVALEVIITWLEDAVSEQKSASGFLRGQLTFCSMLPMRSIPFKVVVLMGLNDGEFPKVDRLATFDLLDQQFIKGDRSRRADDRYQFLEVLMSAREQLIISYIGHSISQNQALPPSVVVSELLDVLQRQYQLEELICQHPLQPFSYRYFNAQEALFSYTEDRCKTAQALQQATPILQDWWQGQVPVTESENKVIELADLFAFFRNPQKFFIQRVLSIRLTGVEQKAPESEPFVLNGLEDYQINQRLIAEALQGRELTTQHLQAEGCWPAGQTGAMLTAHKQAELGAFIETLQDLKLGASLPDQNIDIIINGYRLVGKLAHCYQNGSLLFRYTDLKAKDFMQAWLQHLLFNQLRPQDTHLLARDTHLFFSKTQEQSDYLGQLLDIYQQGQYRPSSFLLGPALAYVKQAKALTSSRSKKPAIDVAREHLDKELSSGFNPELSLIYRYIEDSDELLDAQFEHYCNDLLLPVWEACHDS